VQPERPTAITDAAAMRRRRLAARGKCVGQALGVICLFYFLSGESVLGFSYAAANRSLWDRLRWVALSGYYVGTEPAESLCRPRATQQDAQMKVCTGADTGIADVAHLLADTNRLADAYLERASEHVRVQA
jgi:hypothetical protein